MSYLFIPVNMRTYICKRGIILPCILFIAFICSGSHSNVTDPKMASINVYLESIDSDTISFDSLFCDVTLIPLENKRDAMLSFVPKMMAQEDKYIIFNLDAYPSVLLFNSDGTFQKQVGKLGHGHGEYEYVFDVSAREDGDIVLSTFDKFLVYDSDGLFLQSEKAPEDAYMKNIQCFSGGLICASNYSGSESLINIFDNSYKRCCKMLTSDGVSLGNPPRMNRTLNVQGDTLYYFNPYASEIMLLDLSEHKLLKKYALVSDKMQTLELSEKAEASSTDLRDVDVAYYYYVEDGKVICNLSFHAERAFLEVDVANDRYALWTQEGWFPEIYDIHNQYYYSVLSQEEMLDLMKGRLYTTPRTRKMILEAYEKTGRELTEKDNFVIMRFKSREI